jgi:hypothetical protein
VTSGQVQAKFFVRDAIDSSLGSSMEEPVLVAGCVELPENLEQWRVVE